MDLSADTSGGANVLNVGGAALAAMLKRDDPGPVTFSLDNGVKDLHTMLAQGHSLGIEMR